MNLYTPGKGLFDTHVTWEDIEEDMQRELNTVASFGPNKTAKNIGDGKGFMSRIILIDPDWQHKDKVLPERFVVKILTQLAMQTLTKQISEKNGMENYFSKEDFMAAFEQKQKRCHNVEVALYSYMQKIPPEKFPSPRIYYMRRFSESNLVKGYIIMEYMENFKIINIYENVPLEAVKEALHALAVMESVSLKLSAAEKQEFPGNFFQELYGEFLEGEKLSASMKSLRASADSRLEKKIDKVESYLTDIADVVKADQLADEMGMERVICHGDLWSANLLWKQDASGDIHLSALVDFQTAHIGCPAGDLVRLLSSCLSGKDRQQHWEELLEEFYSYLKEEIGDGRMPYTLEQLKESYKRFTPLGSFLIVAMIQPIYETACKNPDEEQKKKILEGIVEKMEYLLEDIILYQERNLNLRKEKQSQAL